MMNAAPKVPRCPECRAPALPEFKPFCSKRCADVDLARWLTGGYAIPAVPDGADDADDDSPGADGAAH
jgi:uncharacterized protein